MMGRWAVVDKCQIFRPSLSTNSVTEITGSGASPSYTAYKDASINTPLFLAVDGPGNVWIGNNGGNSVTEITGSGPSATYTVYTGGNMNQPLASLSMARVTSGSQTGKAIQSPRSRAPARAQAMQSTAEMV